MIVGKGDPIVWMPSTCRRVLKKTTHHKKIITHLLGRMCFLFWICLRQLFYGLLRWCITDWILLLDNYFFHEFFWLSGESAKVPEILWCSSMWKVMRFSNVIFVRKKTCPHSRCWWWWKVDSFMPCSQWTQYKQWESYSLTMYTWYGVLYDYCV